MRTCTWILPSALPRLILGVALSIISPAWATIKVACCGDSITYGVGVPDRSTQSYPAVLQGLLGGEYQVMRPAAGGLTLLKKGDYSFWKDNAYSGTIAAQPNIIVVLLGTNDSKPINWQYGAEFEADYHALIDSFSGIPTHPKIMLALPPPSYENPNGIRDSVITGEIIPKILRVAQDRNLEVIDTNTPFQDKRYLMPDGIHPGAEGYELIAAIFQDAILNGGLTSPPRPRGLTALAGNGEVALSWIRSAGAASYNIKRAEDSGGPYVTIAEGVVGTSYTDSEAGNDVTYYYVVSANVTTVGESPNSLETSVTPTDPPPPALLTAAAGNAQVSLAWAASSGATSYNVFRATVSGGPYLQLAEGHATTSYIDAGLANGTTYYYIVTAVNELGDSPPSGEHGATPSDPPAPLGLAAAAGKGQVSLSWASSPGATSYNIKRATVDGGPYTTVATGITATSFTNTNLTYGITYYFVISAVGALGESPDSAQVRSIPKVPSPPPAPTGLAAAAGNGQVALAWNSSATAVSYNVKRATVSGGPYTIIASGVTATSYVNTGLSNGTTYYYVVSAVNLGGQSANSAAVAATPTEPAPSSPTGLVATAGNAEAVLAWNAAAGATAYRVKRAVTGGGPYALVAAGVIGTSYNDLGLSNGTTYYYVVSATNGGGESADSAEAAVTPTASILPNPWQKRDIGSVGMPGTATYDDDVFTVDGSGADISGPRDAFHYVYQTSSGDCSIVARVVSVENTNANAKAGVMIRESLNNNSAYAAIVVTATAGIKLQWRMAAGSGTSSGVGVSGRMAPQWIRLTQVEGVFTASYSADGVVWTQLGSPLAITMGGAAYIGLPVTSHDNTKLCTAQFDFVTVTP